MIDFTNMLFLLNSRELEQGGWFSFITEPISVAFGWIINLIFGGILEVLGPVNSLGIAIVIMTIIFRFVMLPMMLHSQKSMMKMREMKPELDKLKEKYGNSKDPEIMRKFQQEQSALMSKHGANPLMGCLPLLIQMPLFIGLNTVMRNSAVYIGQLRDRYEALAESLLAIPGGIAEYSGAIYRIAIVPRTGIGRGGEGVGPTGYGSIVPTGTHHNPPRNNWLANLDQIAADIQAQGLWEAMTPEGLRDFIASHDLDAIVLGIPEHLARIISRFNPTDWEYVYDAIEYTAGVAQRDAIAATVNEIATIETFLGVSMVENSGIIIAVLTGVSMLISTWLVQQRTYDPNADSQQAMMQKMMLFVMPAMIGFFTVNLVAAVGIFWITGQLFQIVQDLIYLKRTGTKIRLPFVKQPEVVDTVPVKKKKK